MTSKYIAITLITTLFLFEAHVVFAGPTSTNFELKSYGFGAGGTDGTGLSSTNFKSFGMLGETDTDRPSSTNFKVGSGLQYTLSLNTPPSPTLSNPATNYDRLQVILNQGGNKSDVTYAMEISTDNFASDVRYIKSDSTVGSTLATTDFKLYSNWGGASGFFVSGLKNGTTYKVRAKARLGNFSETQWGPASSGITTSDPSLTFSLDSSTITFANLNAGNAYTDNAKTSVLTTSTNAYNGYIVYAKETQALTSPNSTISDYGSGNSAPTTWSGNGFGYTTSDASLPTGGTANRFSGGKYAGLSTTASSNPVADNLGPVQSSAISNEQFTITYRVTTSATQPVGTYSNTIEYIVLPTY